MYRTPKPEEFTNGFRFEMYVNKSWIPCSYGKGFLVFPKYFIEKGIIQGQEIFRVKI